MSRGHGRTQAAILAELAEAGPDGLIVHDLVIKITGKDAGWNWRYHSLAAQYRKALRKLEAEGLVTCAGEKPGTVIRLKPDPAYPGQPYVWRLA